MRGDSRQDLYAKTLALMALGLLAGAGALVDYWPADLDVPRAASAVIRPARAQALAVPASLPTLVVESESSRGPEPRRPAPEHALPMMVASSVTAEPAALEPPTAVLPSTFDVPAMPVASVPAQVIELPNPAPNAAATIPDQTVEPIFDSGVRQVASGANVDDSFFLTDAFKTAGGSIATAGGSIVTAGVKTGQSVADAFRAAAGAFRKLKFF